MRPHLSDWVEEYGLAGREHCLRVPPSAPLVGRALEALDLRGSAGVNVVAIERASGLSRELFRPVASTVLQAGDVLLIDLFSSAVDIAEISRRFGLEPLPLAGVYFLDRSQEIGMVEVMVPPTSNLIDKTVVTARFRSERDLNVIGLRRGGIPHAGSVVQERLQVGDTLLLIGPWRAIRRLQSDWRDLIVLALPAELDEVLPAPRRMPHALATLALVVFLMVTGVVPNVVAALVGCLLLGLLRCVDVTSAYRSIHWQSLVLIVGMMPFAIALQRTGGFDLAAAALVDTLGGIGTHAVLAGLFVLTALLGLFISNTATAILVAPIALDVADQLGASPYPFAMIVALAASAAFMTPVSSPVNALVVAPGNYRFADFVRVGVPFTLIVMAASVVLVPWILPP